MTGEVSGLLQPEIEPFLSHLTFTVASGTGELEGATGSLTVELMSVAAGGGISTTGTIEGSITVRPRTPSSKDDCKDGGWRDFEDENGVPFRNQGECIAWVNAH